MYNQSIEQTSTRQCISLNFQKPLPEKRFVEVLVVVLKTMETWLYAEKGALVLKQA